VKALKAIRALDERFATDYVVNIIIGRLTPNITMFRHEGISEVWNRK
jgi:ATP-dependent DNA helicase RecQ